MPSGQLIEPYHVLEYPDWINVVALTTDLEIVLVRQYRHGAGQVLDELPSGVIERSDRSPQEAASRELREETGFSGDRFIPVGQYSPNPANHSNICYTFFAPQVSLVGAAQPDATEDLEVVILPFKDYLRKTWSGELPIQGLHGAALYFTSGYLMRTQEESLRELRKAIFGA
jgi:8-oxo-dGTP pyrophosphatase MutT (NUDIX family)